MPKYCDTVQDRLGEFGYTVCYNPEFIQQGDIIKGMTKPDMVLIGGDERGCAHLVEHYKHITTNNPPMHTMTRKEAEITKIALNCFLTTKIAFANSIGDLVNIAGGDPAVVLDAIGSDSRVGKKFLRWGHGFGGPCLPRDNRALCHFADSIGFKHRIGETTDYCNGAHLHLLADFIQSKNTESLPYYFDSVVYKKGTLILEESQQLFLAKTLAERGAAVIIHDVPEIITELKKTYATMFTYSDGSASSLPSSVFDISNYVK
jgi:UDPglucose 6-dehydrogenase